MVPFVCWPPCVDRNDHGLRSIATIASDILMKNQVDEKNG